MIASPALGQRATPIKKSIATPRTVTAIPTDFSDGLNRIRTLTTERRFALVLLELNALTVRAKTMQQQSIQSALPGTPDGFSVEPPQSADDADSPYIVFSRSYLGPENCGFEFTITMSDPSIDEYRQMIQNPASVALMDDTKIIEFKSGFLALEKYTSSDGIYERHIILGNNLMVTVIGHGISDRSRIDTFCDALDLARVQSELRQ